jgi:hypothetical protein
MELQKTSKITGQMDFCSLVLDKEYVDKWNIHLSDFLVLTHDGEIVRNTLYRKGGYGDFDIKKDRYIMILKHVEAYYPDEITKIKKDKPHLEGLWCVMDNQGNEKFIQESSLYTPSLIRHSCLYCYKNKYYHIETGYCYGESRKTIESAKCIFIEVYNIDTHNYSVLKIYKEDGTYEKFE